MFYFTFIVITYYWKLQPYKFSQFQFIESFLVHMITFNICMNILPKAKIYIFIKFVPNFFFPMQVCHISCETRAGEFLLVSDLLKAEEKR